MELIITYEERELPMLRDPIRVSVDSGLTVDRLIQSLVEKLHLPVFDPHVGGSLQYSLHRFHPGPPELLDTATRLGDMLIEGEALRLRSVTNVNAISNDERGMATFNISGHWSVKDFEQLLGHIRTSYVNVFAQNELLMESKRIEHHPYEFRQLQSRHDAIVSNLKSSEDLIIQRIQLASPGLLEVLGALNPLETIARYLKDRQQARIEERKLSSEESKDANYRNALEKAKHVLEIESLKTQVAKDRALFLRDAGFSQEEVRPYIDAVLQQPLEKLANYQLQERLEVTTVKRLELPTTIQIVRDPDMGGRLLGG